MAKDETAPEGKASPKAAAKPAPDPAARKDVDDTTANPFLLEALFPDPVDLFRPSLVPKVEDGDVIVAIDTNALLLPYAIGKDDFSALADRYRKLAGEGRLFLPARSAREFIKHRDRKIAELVQTISDRASKISVEGVASPILQGIEGYDALKKAGKALVDGRRAYLKALEGVRAGVVGWRGNDPITNLYAEVFTANNVIEHEGEADEVQQDWARRCADKTPPGYKDAGKADGGVGDYLIWLALLRLGREQKKHLIFVTGEEKSDWFVRSGGEAVFARPELIVEYRQASGGKNLQLSSLSGLLEQFGTDGDIVEEVRTAEASANTAARILSASRLMSSVVLTTGYGGPGAQAVLDYSRNNGHITVSSPKGGFDLAFSRASDVRIHLYRTSGVVAVMRLKGAAPDIPLNIEEFDGSSDSYTLEVGEAFAVLNIQGEVLIGRIVAIDDGTRGPEADRVEFRYRIFKSGMPLTPP